MNILQYKTERKKQIKGKYNKYQTLCPLIFDARAIFLKTTQYVHAITKINTEEVENSLYICSQEKTVEIKFNTKLNEEKNGY